jgi:hypothetical protein
MRGAEEDVRKDLLARQELLPVWAKLQTLVTEVVDHSGYGEVHVAVRWLSKGRKEIILSSGKEYRFVIQAKVEGKESES